MVFLPTDRCLRGKAIMVKYADAMTIFEAKMHETYGCWFEKIVLFEPMASDIAILLANPVEEGAIICDSSNVDFAEGFRKLAGIDTELEKFRNQTIVRGR